MATIQDNRTDDEKTATTGFVVFTDRFMSGWGGAANGRSLYALAVDANTSIDRILDNARRRPEMKRGRWVKTLRNVKLGRNDHLSIVGPDAAGPWYEQGAFAK